MNHGNKRKAFSTRSIAAAAMMAVLVFIGTFFFKIPVAVTEGYIHLGDCMIILGVLFLGWKKGAAAGAAGAALADLFGGYVHWVLPTLVIKAALAVIMGFFLRVRLPGKRYTWVVGAALGGIVQVVGYALAEVFFYGPAPALAGAPGNILQTAAGIVLAGGLVRLFDKNHLTDKLSR